MSFDEIIKTGTEFLASHRYKKYIKLSNEPVWKFVLDWYNLTTLDKDFHPRKIWFHFSSKLDYIPKCIICGNPCKWNEGLFGYPRVCSYKCNAKWTAPIRAELSLAKYGCVNPSSSQIVKDRRTQTVRDRYGVNNVSELREVKRKIKEWHLAVSDEDRINMMCLQLKNSKRWKNYILPSGKLVLLQGNESYALDVLLEFFEESEISCRCSDIPTFRYVDSKDVLRKYYPDFYIKKLNLVVEVKSTFTYSKYLDINTLKRNAVLSAGYNFVYMIFFNRGKYVNKDDLLDVMRKTTCILN